MCSRSMFESEYRATWVRQTSWACSDARTIEREGPPVGRLHRSAHCCRYENDVWGEDCYRKFGVPTPISRPTHLPTRADVVMRFHITQRCMLNARVARMNWGIIMIKGFKNFLLQGELIVIAVGLVVALAFNTLIKSFTDSIITPLVNAFEGSGAGSAGLGWSINGQRLEIGAFISAIVYFVIFMTVIYFALVVPYRVYMARKGTTVFGPPAPTKKCPKCLSSDLPVEATKCRYCTSDVE
jgi:large conductance mechanosensitive channel